MKRYNPKEVEPKWQKIWDETGVYTADLGSDKPKYIAMSMFNYPSGAGIHIGHAMNYTISDVKARFKRQQGYESYHPVGWDAFGLPAENYAIKAGVSPQESMATIIPSYHKQYKAMGWSNDWEKEISTHLPEYYKWTQWIFSEMFRHKLAYQDSRMQWWCTKCQTVLANEQVIDGKCWRHDGPDDLIVEKKEVKQWFFKITDYADELLEAIDELDWTESVKLAQKNWIGRSVGAEIKFKVDDSKETIDVFTTRPDTLFGAAFIVLAPEHDLVKKITTKAQHAEVENYIKATQKKTEIERQENKEKTGVFTGSYATNPANNKQIPIWVADFVLGGYGTGAVFGDAHDERDIAFAKKFNIPVFMTVEPVAIREDAQDKKTDVKKDKIVAIVTNDKDELLTINWGPKLGGRLFIGGTVEGKESPETTARREVTEETGYADLDLEEVGEETFHYKYYAFSKQETHETDVKFVKLRLKTNKQVAQKLDDSEKNNFNVEWVSRAQAEKEIIEPLHRYGFDKFILGAAFTGEGILFNSGKYDGMSTFEARDKIVADLAGQIGDKTVDVEFENNGEPIFIQKTDSSAVKKDQPFVEREAILAIVKHWKEDKYIGLKWKKVDWQTVITGGVEAGQSAEEAALREIQEETGYLNPVLKRNLGKIHARFFHVPKNENRLAHFNCLYFELTDDKHLPISKDEQQNHEVVWLSKKEMEKFRLPASQRYVWDILTEKAGIAKTVVNYRMRDWSVSRQRYWGAPIPIVNCHKCGTVLIPDENLPVELPVLDDFQPSGDGRSALARATDWLKTTCPECGGSAERETDTLDTYICSSWYMYRYFDPRNQEQIFDSNIVKKWEPIDFYNGADHATAHLLYARFIGHFFKKLGLVNKPEPFKQFLFNGKVTASDGSAFSKSKGNGIDPLEIINSGYGADALRTYLMFAAPLEFGARWDPQGVPGTHRFLSRIWNLVQEYQQVSAGKTPDDQARAMLRTTNQMIKKVTVDIEENRYNTAIAASMSTVNDLYKFKVESFHKNEVWQQALDSLVACVAPFAPHIADELWRQLGHTTSVQVDTWPKWDDKLLDSDTMTIVIQVNGKLRGEINVAKDAEEKAIVSTAKKDKKVAGYLKDIDIKKTIYVPGKLVNFVI